MRQDKALNLVGLVALCTAVGCSGTVTEIDPGGDGSGGGSSSDSGSATRTSSSSSSSSSGSGGTTNETASSGSRTSGSSTSRSTSVSSTGGSGGTGGTGGEASTTVSSSGVTTTRTVTTTTSTSAGGAVGTITTTNGGTTVGTFTVTGAGGTSSITVTGSTGGSGGSGGYPNVDFPDDCRVDYGYQDRDWCELGLECSNTWIWAYCDSYNSSSWQCGCETDNFWNEYTLSGVDDQDACPITASLCADPDQVDFTGPLECAPVYQEQQSDYCSMEIECTQSTEINEYVTAERREWQWIYCYGNGNDFQCDCNSGDGYTSLTIEDYDSSSLCPDMLEICNSGVEGQGPRTCEPRSQFSQTGYCSAEQLCTQQTTLDGSNVLINSSISTDCREATAGEWDCDCYMAPGNTSFTISSDDSWDACTEASQACAVAAGAE